MAYQAGRPSSKKESIVEKARRKEAERVRRELGPNATDDEVLACLSHPPKPRQPSTLRMTRAEETWNKYHNILEWVGHNATYMDHFGTTGRPKLITNDYKQHVASLPNLTESVAPATLTTAYENNFKEARHGLYMSGATSYAIVKLRQMHMAHMFEGHMAPNKPMIADAWGVYARHHLYWTTQWLPFHLGQLKWLQGPLTFWLHADDTGCWKIDPNDFEDLTDQDTEYSQVQQQSLLSRIRGTQHTPDDSRHNGGGGGGGTHAKTAAARPRFSCRHSISHKHLAKYLPKPIADILAFRDPDSKKPNKATLYPPANPIISIDVMEPNEMKVNALQNSPMTSSSGGQTEEKPPLDFIMYFESLVITTVGISRSPTAPALTERHNAWTLGDVDSAMIMVGGRDLLKRLAPETRWEEEQYYKDHPLHDEYSAKAYDGTVYYPRKYLNRREIAKIAHYREERNAQGESASLDPSQIRYEVGANGVSFQVKGLEESDLQTQFLMSDDDTERRSKWIQQGRPHIDNSNMLRNEHLSAHAAALISLTHAPPTRLIQFENVTNEWERPLFSFLSGTYALQIPCKDPRWLWTALPMHMPPAYAVPPDWIHTFITRVFAATRHPQAEDQSYEFAAVYMPTIYPPSWIDHRDPFLNHQHTPLSFQSHPDDTEDTVGTPPRHGEAKVWHATAHNSAYMQFSVEPFQLSDLNSSENPVYHYRAQSLYNTALNHAHQLLLDRFRPEEKRPARIMLPPEAPREFMQKNLTVHWSFLGTRNANSTEDNRQRSITQHKVRRTTDDLEQSSLQLTIEEATPYVSRFFDLTSATYPMEHLSSIDLRQASRVSYIPAAPDHDTSQVYSLAHDGVPSVSSGNLFVLYRESVLFEIQQDTNSARVLRQHTLSARTSPYDAKAAKTIPPTHSVGLQGTRMPHITTTPSIDFGGRYVAVAYRDPVQIDVIQTSDPSTQLDSSLTSVHSISPQSVQALAMDHTTLSYIDRDQNGAQVHTLRNWATDTFSSPVSWSNTLANTTDLRLMAVSYDFYVLYDYPSHTLHAQFRSPAVTAANAAAPWTLSLRTKNVQGRVNALSVLRVRMTTYVLYGTTEGEAGYIALDWNDDGTNASTSKDLHHRMLGNGEAIEDIRYADRSTWNTAENNFRQDLEALYFFAQDDQGNTKTSPDVTNKSNTTSVTLNGNATSAAGQGVFIRGESNDAVEFQSSTQDSIQIPLSQFQDNSNALYDTFTVSVWFRRKAASTEGIVFQSHTNVDQGYTIQLEETQPGGTVVLAAYDQDTSRQELAREDTQGVDFTQWTLLTISRRNISNTSTLEITVNDDIENRTTFSPFQEDRWTTGDVWIGYSTNTNSSPPSNVMTKSFQGYVDYLGLWTEHALPPLDVHLWFNAQRAVPSAYLTTNVSSNNDRLFYAYSVQRDGSTVLWDTAHNKILWRYQNVDTDTIKGNMTQHNEQTVGLVDVLPLQVRESNYEVLQYRNRPDSEGTEEGHDVLVMRHPYAYPEAQLIGRRAWIQRRSKRSPGDTPTEVTDTRMNDNIPPPPIFAFPATFQRAQDDLADDTETESVVDRSGFQVHPFARLQSREPWRVFLTGNAWTNAFWTRLDAFAFASADRNPSIDTIPLLSIGGVRSGLQLWLHYVSSRQSHTLDSSVTHYYRLDDIQHDSTTNNINDLSSSAHATNHGGYLVPVDTLSSDDNDNDNENIIPHGKQFPWNAATQALQKYLDKPDGVSTTNEWVMRFPPLSNTTDTQITPAHVSFDSTSFTIDTGESFSLGVWIQPTLFAASGSLSSSSDGAAEILFRTDTADPQNIVTNANVLEILYERTHHRILVNAKDTSQRVSLQASLDNPTTKAKVSQYDTARSGWYFVLVTRSNQGKNMSLWVNDQEIDSVIKKAPTGQLSTNGQTAFLGSNHHHRQSFQGGIRDLSFWRNTDLGDAPQSRDILYNYGEIRTYPFTVPYAHAWELQLHAMSESNPGQSVVSNACVRTPVDARLWALEWQALSVEWNTDWSNNEHVFSVWHGNGHVQNLEGKDTVVKNEVARVSREDVPFFFSSYSPLWLGATPITHDFKSDATLMGSAPSVVLQPASNGYPSPAFAHVSSWSRTLTADEFHFFLHANRAVDQPEPTQAVVHPAVDTTTLHPLRFTQYGRSHPYEQAAPVDTHRDIARHPHRRWLFILSHKSYPVPIASFMWPVMHEQERQFHNQLQSQTLPPDLRDALSKNGAQVVYHTWGGSSMDRPDTFGNQTPNYDPASAAGLDLNHPLRPTQQ